MNVTFRQSVWLAVIEKLLLASIVLIIGLCANYLIEKSKRKDLFQEKVAEMRLDRIVEVLSILHELEMRIEYSHSFIYKDPRGSTPRANHAKDKQIIPQKIEAAQTSLAKNRLWLGPDVYKRCAIYLNNLTTTGRLLPTDIDQNDSLNQHRSELADIVDLVLKKK